MDCCSKYGYDTEWIVDFIRKKDINIIKRYIKKHHLELSDIFKFDKDLLTEDWKDFKQKILNAYHWS